jgi:hypothetical protein
MWQYTSERNGRADEGIKFFIATDSQLKMARGDTLDLEIFCGVLFGFG